MVFDVGRWNLLNTTLGTLGLVVGIMLKTHHVETISESPGQYTDHQEVDGGC